MHCATISGGIENLRDMLGQSGISERISRKATAREWKGTGKAEAAE